MKSFIAYPIEFESLLYPYILNKKSIGLNDHTRLFRQVRLLDGIIVKCGITLREGFSRFDHLRGILGENLHHRMVAFEKPDELPAFELQTQQSSLSKASAGIEPHVTHKKIHMHAKEHVEFVPGCVSNTIPEYLIENPEVKIAVLNIDMNDYEETMTAMEFLYPRLVQNGILILENYSKNEAEKNAIDDYFAPGKVIVNSIGDQNGPHFIVRE